MGPDPRILVAQHEQAQAMATMLRVQLAGQLTAEVLRHYLAQCPRLAEVPAADAAAIAAAGLRAADALMAALSRPPSSH